MVRKIWFDMDGTIANLYGVNGWLEMLNAQDPTPYAQAEPMVNMANLARLLHKAQRLGYEIGIISWLAKTATAEYDMAVTEIKIEWLQKHLPSVEWNEIHIVPYGTPKQMFCKNPLDVLFDDEERNRTNWTGRAYDVQNIMEILREI